MSKYSVDWITKRMADGPYSLYTPSPSFKFNPDEKEEKKEGNAFWPPKVAVFDHAKPVYQDIRILLIGCQGAGKSTLFNRLTGQKTKVSSGIRSCTHEKVEHNCINPFGGVTIVDTPGMGSKESDIEYNDAYQLREAFIRQPVNMIALVCNLQSNSRADALITALKPMEKIMTCRTFKLDANGMLEPSRATRVLLVLTHRDTFIQISGRRNWHMTLARVRNKYSWIGGAIMIDLNVDVLWLLSNIVTPAACMNKRDYHIPMIEFCTRFPISRELDFKYKSKISCKKAEFVDGMDLAIREVNKIISNREKTTATSSRWEDKLGPSMDCILRFVDDLWERKTLEALASLYDMEIDDLWLGDDDENEKRVLKWNAVRSYMGEEYEKVREDILEIFPLKDTTALYKKCGYCQAVYVKPVGCDGPTICGLMPKGIKDDLQWTYEYEEEKAFIIQKNKGMSGFEKYAHELRDRFSKMVKKNPEKFYGVVDTPATEKEKEYLKLVTLEGFGKGCGALIQWSTMVPLSRDELKKHELIPELVKYMPVKPQDEARKFVEGKLDRLCNEWAVSTDKKLSREQKLMELELKVYCEIRRGNVDNRIIQMYVETFGEDGNDQQTYKE